MNFFDLGIFSSGILLGIYLDQTYVLPKVEIIVKNVWSYLKRYEPPKKDAMELDDL